MKNKLQLAFIACTLLVSSVNVEAYPKRGGRQTARVRALCQNEETRIMMIRELMNTKESREKMARMLECGDNNEFRSSYETHTVNPG